MWDDLPRPVLGSFDITVRGPLGRGANRTLFVAEGLESRFQPGVRLFEGRGLERGRAELIAPVVNAQLHQKGPRVAQLRWQKHTAVAGYRHDSRTAPRRR
ncbi:hypothetical protein K7G98_37120, partial [Saccharothrix sp. MB29]|nr:hypothetical protein [Saccharothrix sp. MB29]